MSIRKVLLSILVGLVQALIYGVALHTFGLDAHAWGLLPIGIGFASGVGAYKVVL